MDSHHYVYIDDLTCHAFERKPFCTHHSDVGAHHHVNVYALKGYTLQ